MAFRNSWLSRPRFSSEARIASRRLPEFPELRQPVPNAGDRHLIKAAGMLLTVPGNEGHRGAVVQQSNRGLHLLSGQVKLTGNMGNLDVNHGRQFCTLSARIVSCCRIEESYPNFSTWGLLSRVNSICRFALTRALHGVAAWDHLWYSVNVGKAWVKAVEFGSGVVGAEPPVDGDARCVALALVGGDLALQCVRVGISPPEAGAAQRAEFDLCHPFGKLRTGLSQLACLGVW